MSIARFPVFILLFFSTFILFILLGLGKSHAIEDQVSPMGENASSADKAKLEVSQSDGSSVSGGNFDTKTFFATVIDAEVLTSVNRQPNSNKQMVVLSVRMETPSGIRNDNIEVPFYFPNNEFKQPLRIGDQLLIESTYNLEHQKFFNFISYYRQNNLVAWLGILLGMLLVVSGFRKNLKYIFILLIFLVSTSIVLFFYRKSTYLMFSLLFLWQLIASYLYASKLFHKTLPALILPMTIFVNQMISILLVYFMDLTNVFDVGVFDLFFPSINDARFVMMYVFAVIVTYPICVIFAEQIIAHALGLKYADPNISRYKLVKSAFQLSFKYLNIIFFTFFGMFFSVFVIVIALSSEENYYTLQTLNTASLVRFLSLGILVLLNLVVFIPLVSVAIGTLIGKLERHKLITDRNLKNLEVQ